MSTGTLNFLKENRRFRSKEVPDITPQSRDVRFHSGWCRHGRCHSSEAERNFKNQNIADRSRILREYFYGYSLVAPLLQLVKNINWEYRTKSSNKYCFGMKNNSCNWPAGKVIGGSSVLNFMIANRSSADYDRWAEMGNEGWAYKDVLKYFKKLETMDIPELKSNTIYHGTDRPIHITYPVFHTPLAEDFLKAGTGISTSRLQRKERNRILIRADHNYELA